MIKQLPGWLNFILLWVFYFGVGILLDLICGWHTDKRFIGFFTAFYAGGYLAKYRAFEAQITPDGKIDTKWRFW